MPADLEAWTRTRRDLLAFFRRRVGDEHAAEDLVQETLVRIHSGLGDLRDEERLSAWVARIARHVLIDHRRAARPAEGADVEAVAEDAPADENENRAVEACLRAMLALLPEEQRDAVAAVELEGRTQIEVAQRLGLSPSGVKSRVQRGRARLRSLLLACCHLETDRRGNVLHWQRHDGCAGCEGG